jgi:KDO2-lipid IV(A) lauroyltransferase
MKRLLYRASRWLKQANYWLVARAALTLLWLLRKLPPDRAMDFAGRMARRLGPLSGRHRIALDNLRLAYPELDEAARREIALDMWENMADAMQKMAAGLVHPVIDTEVDFDGIGEALKRMESRDVFGKIILRVG